MARKFTQPLAIATCATLSFCVLSALDNSIVKHAHSIENELDPLLISSSSAAFLLLLFLIFEQNKFRQKLLKRKSARVAEVKNRLQRQHQALRSLTTSALRYRASLTESLRELNQLVVRTLNVSHCGVWKVVANSNSFECLDLYHGNSATHVSGIPISAEVMQPFIEQLCQSRVLCLSESDAHPLCRNSPLKRYKFLSLLAAPVFVEGKLCAIVFIADSQMLRRWKIDEQDFCGSIADIISSTLEAQERKKIRQELEHKSHAIEQASDGIAILDHQERFVFVNQSHSLMYGYDSPAELIGKTWHVLYDSQELERFQSIHMPQFRTQGHLTLEATGLKKSGEKFFQELSLSALEGGGLICVVRDCSDKKRAQAELYQNKKFLRDIIDTDPNFIFVKDRNGKFLTVNQAVADVYGTSVESIIGKTDADFNPQSEEVERFRQDDLRVILERKQHFISEEKITDSTGKTRWLQTVKRPLEVGPNGEVHVLGVSNDITAHKLLHEQLLQAHKMEAIGQLAGGVAHDFNNLLTAIYGYASASKKAAGSNRMVLKNTELIENAAQRAAELTQKLLGFARKGKNQNIPIDLHATVEESLALLHRTIERTITLSTRLNAEDSTVLGDPVQIEQIILNLVLNARDAVLSQANRTREARINVLTRLLEFRSPDQLPDSSLKPGHYIELSVRDTGCGIPTEHRQRLFEPFFTTKEIGKGTGMGLAMVYGIVKNHSGAIRVRSTPGKGSCFSVFLPLSPVPLPLETQSAKVSIANSFDCASGHILLVDDHKEVREVTANMLSSLGYEVSTARDGVEALNYYREHLHQVDLVILDLVMPRMGARECFRVIKTINPQARAILSTGYVNNNSVQEMMSEGVRAYVQKPYHLSKLSEVIATVLRD